MNFDSPIRTKGLRGIEVALIEFEWNIFLGLTSLEILQKIQEDLQDRIIEFEELEDRIIFMPMSMTSNGQREETQNNVFQIPKNKSRTMRRDFREDTGHSWALENEKK